MSRARAKQRESGAMSRIEASQAQAIEGGEEEAEDEEDEVIC